ncbi:MAG: hypothetical protein OJF60_002185 [Burkholderiaceae bacterium]|jgi:hypothetical protein|nr:MAG: hypothetical protein OJF60_002185 [Burkholderiaceae bacterium]
MPVTHNEITALSQTLAQSHSHAALMLAAVQQMCSSVLGRFAKSHGKSSQPQQVLDECIAFYRREHGISDSAFMSAADGLRDAASIFGHLERIPD